MPVTLYIYITFIVLTNQSVCASLEQNTPMRHNLSYIPLSHSSTDHNLEICPEILETRRPPNKISILFTEPR